MPPSAPDARRGQRGRPPPPPSGHGRPYSSLGPSAFAPSPASGSAPAPKAQRQSEQLAAPDCPWGGGRRARPLGWSGRCLVATGCPWAGFADVGKPFPKCGSEVGTCSRRGTQTGPVILGRIPGKHLDFYQRGHKLLAPLLMREGRPQAVGSRAEGRGTLHISISHVGAQILISHPCPEAAASHVGSKHPQRVTG